MGQQPIDTPLPSYRSVHTFRDKGTITTTVSALTKGLSEGYVRIGTVSVNGMQNLESRLPDSWGGRWFKQNDLPAARDNPGQNVEPSSDGDWQAGALG